MCEATVSRNCWRSCSRGVAARLRSIDGITSFFFREVWRRTWKAPNHCAAPENRRRALQPASTTRGQVLSRTQCRLRICFVLHTHWLATQEPPLPALHPHRRPRCRCSPPASEGRVVSATRSNAQGGAHNPRTICHTCMMLSTAQEAITQSSFSFQLKSDTLLVCPPWMNCKQTARQPVTPRPRLMDACPPTHQQLRRSVLSVLGALLCTDPAGIPHVDTAVGSARCQDLYAHTHTHTHTQRAHNMHTL